MKQVFFILIFLLMGSFSLCAQKINYESSFEKARQLALEQQKPIAVLITIQPPVPLPNFFEGINNESVIETYNRNFINYKVDRADTASSTEIIKRYKISRFPSFIFLDQKGGLMFTEVARLSSYKALLDIANRAILASKEKSIVDYDNAYHEGNVTTSFLKEYILKREGAGITDNADLIEKYVLGLKVSELNDYDEVLFILKAGPFADGKAYKLIRLNKSIIDSIYKTEPESERIAINNAIVSNTMRSAIADKNYSRAIVAANSIRDTWTNNRFEGQKKWYLKMMQYYLGVNDTANYLSQASAFYDRYYMEISADSLKKIDSLNYEQAKNKAMQFAQIDLNHITTTQTISFSYAKNNIASELNNVAWNFYLMAAGQSNYLLKAMLWSRHAIDLNPENPSFYDTYAHLLYKLNFFDEAESMEKKAIELGKAMKADTRSFQNELGKIKNRAL